MINLLAGSKCLVKHFYSERWRRQNNHCFGHRGGVSEKGKMVITDQAKLALQDILKENGKEGIRLYSAGEGCCGPQLGLSLEDPQTTDRVEKMNGIQVAIDEQVSSIIEGITLDAEETGEGIHFVLLGLNQSC
jgi:HesB-like selenoprotein